MLDPRLPVGQPSWPWVAALRTRRRPFSWSAHPEVEEEEQHGSDSGVYNVVSALGTVHDLHV